jgi:hypothetical protein
MILDSKNLIYKAVYHGARSFIEVFSTLERSKAGKMCRMAPASSLPITKACSIHP